MTSAASSAAAFASRETLRPLGSLGPCLGMSRTTHMPRTTPMQARPATAAWRPWVGSNSFTATCSREPRGQVRGLEDDVNIALIEASGEPVGNWFSIFSQVHLDCLILLGKFFQLQSVKKQCWTVSHCLHFPLSWKTISASLALKTFCYWFSFHTSVAKSEIQIWHSSASRDNDAFLQVTNLLHGNRATSSTFLLTDRKWQNWKQNWIAGITGNHWDRFSRQKILGPSVQNRPDNSEPRQPRTAVQFLSFVWPQCLTSHFDSGLDQNWVTKTFFKATTSGVPFFFYLAGKDPQLLRVLKWHWKLNNLHSTHSTGREC